jgi:hypothetical protein
MDNKGCCSPKGSCSTDKKDSGACDTKKSGCCWSTLIKGGIVAGLVIFVVNSISWMSLPFHKQNMMSFKDEKAVARVIANNAEKSGVYVLPFVADPAKDKPAVDKPYVYATVKAEGVDMKNMNPQLIRYGILSFALGLLLTCLIKKMSCGCPILGSAKIGLLAGLAATMPGVIWFAFPLNEALVCLADTVVAFALAGLVLSKTVLKSCGTAMCCDKPGCGCAKGGCSK